MKRQRRREEEEQNDDAHIHKKQEDNASQFFLVRLKQLHHPSGGGIPKGERRDEQKNCENNSDYKHPQKQIAEDPRTFFSAGTFDEVTIGATFKIPISKPFQSLTIRPELRYDAALTDIKPYGDQDSRDQFTAGIDAILVF